MVGINYSVSVVNTSELPAYKSDWKINTAQWMATGGSDQSELQYITSLGLKPIIDIEMQIWVGGQIQDPISDYASYLKGLYAAGWRYVSSEGGRPGDANYMKSLGLNYVNYNCDQCGLWSAGLHNEAGTVLNFWEAYYPNEVQYMLQGAASGKPNGVLAGAWANNGGDNDILTNSINGSAPSYKSIMDSLVAAGHQVTDFGVWGGDASSRSENDVLGFTNIVQSLQKNGYPANGQPGPTPAPVSSVTFASTPGGLGMDIFVKGSDNALWHSPDDGKTWTSLGGNLTSAPSAITRGTGMDVYVRGSPDGVYMKSWNGTAWSTWFNLGGQVLAGTGPAAYFDGTNVTLEAVGVDKALYRKTWNGTVWSGWVAVAKVIK
jgi:hypothetical protein